MSKRKKKVNDIRAKETKIILLLNFVKSSMFHFVRYSGFLSALLIYYIKAQNGETLRAGPVFSILGSFGFLSLYVGLYIGYAITTIAEFKTTLRRTANILLLEEKSNKFRIKGREEDKLEEVDVRDPEEEEAIISIREASFTWGSKQKAKQQFQNLRDSLTEEQLISVTEKKDYDLVLKRINLEVKKGELLIVIGPVGSGKTSLLLTLLR